MITYLVICKKPSRLKILDSSRYLPLDEIVEFLKQITKAAPNSVTLESIGNTNIKDKSITNEIYLIKIGDPSDHILFFDCGIHAREWIAPASCLYVIQKLVIVFEFKKLIKKNQSLAKWRPILNYQWHFVPILNPDGYQYSHETDHNGNNIEKFRMQRKNLRPVSAMNLTDEMLEKCHDEGNCEGVDLNRNFPAGWGIGHEEFEKESKDPSTSVYKGSHPLSEPESQALHNYMKKSRKKILSAISVHSYGKDIYYPKIKMIQIK